ncbi:MAG: dienelactone hydrolase family protein [Deltaproteobacteria bacterium]|nr:dienelactone hydrolase family protein [Deltaproteobacteria bacterium]
MRIFSHKRLIPYLTSVLLTFPIIFTSGITVAEDRQATVMEHWSAQIIADRLDESLSIGAEIKAYYDRKFPSLTGRLYIEQSGEVVTVHWFADYPDVRSFKRITRQLGSDEEFIALMTKLQGFIVAGTVQQKLLRPYATLEKIQPVANLAQGQEGTIYFASANSGSFKEILASGRQSKPATISGTLSLPKNISRKVPAVIILHGVGGVDDFYFEMADILNEMGIAAFVVDSFENRGILQGLEILKKLFHSYSVRIADAYAALKLLSTHPKIDKDRIAVMGFSHGARVALFVASENIRNFFSKEELQFAASIAYYPGCFPQFEDITFTKAPILMLLAERDNICPVSACLDYARRMQESGVDVKTVVYKGAHHQFPVLSDHVLAMLPGLPDWSHCKKESYILLQDDGSWYYPHKNLTVEEVNVITGEYTADCRINGQAMAGGNSKAKIESIKECQDLLKRVFQLD